MEEQFDRDAQALAGLARRLVSLANNASPGQASTERLAKARNLEMSANLTSSLARDLVRDLALSRGARPRAIRAVPDL